MAPVFPPLSRRADELIASSLVGDETHIALVR
jgi:hypothetical protein